VCVWRLVLHEPDILGLRIDRIDQPAHDFGIVAALVRCAVTSICRQQARGSTITNRLRVPRRSYSQSTLSGLPGSTGAGGCTSACSTRSSPPSRKRWATFWTVACVTANVSATLASSHPSASFSKIHARVRVRALAFP
jgi:hypothetical protein